jgi:hypothetical protein
MTNDKKKDLQRVTTPVARVSFPKVFKADAYEDQEPKFSCTLLFPKTADLSALRKAVHAASVKKWGADEKKWPKNLRSPFNDGNDKTDLQGYKNTIYISAKNKHRPQVVDQKLNPITEEDDTFYAGCFARFSLRAYAYDTKGNKGVSFSLEAIQKHSDGERFSGRKDASEVFGEIEEESEDAENYSDKSDAEESDDDSGW